MCCFSKPVRFVGGTKIFARGLGDGRQALAYSMEVELDSELAMVLPLPVVPRSADDAVRFIDLHGYPTFFDDLSSAFPPMMQPASRGSASFGMPRAKATLVVHDVGDFEASFVPTRAAFVRLDPRFRLPDGVWDDLERYADYGFAVFRLKPQKTLFGRAERRRIHPMAFVFPSREPDALFYPTVHIHDGTIHPTAKFDHALYAQADSVLGATLGWTRSQGPITAFVDVARARGLVGDSSPGFGQALFGELDNDDVWLRPPAGVRLDDLTARGECFAFRACARHAYSFGSADERSTAWRDAATKLGRTAPRIRDGLSELERDRRQALRLAPLTPELPQHFVNGRQLWTGTSYMDGSPGHREGPGVVTFRPFSDRIEPQEIVLGFSELPDETRLAELLAILARVVDSSVPS